MSVFTKIFWSRVVPCGRADVTKLMVVSRNVATTPKYVLRVSTFVYRLIRVRTKMHVYGLGS